jgi:Rrf2 family transcriptional regulator, iron-sulfur cluster assembly transcription factor
MLRTETQYALRVLTELARYEEPCAASDLAQASRVSAPMLAKVLHRLAGLRLVLGRPGPGGGYRLARPAGAISIEEVVLAMEGPDSACKCLFGLPSCSDRSPCPLHEFWGDLRGRIAEVFRAHSIEDLSRRRVAKAGKVRKGRAGEVVGVKRAR